MTKYSYLVPYNLDMGQKKMVKYLIKSKDPYTTKLLFPIEI